MEIEIDDGLSEMKAILTNEMVKVFFSLCRM